MAAITDMFRVKLGAIAAHVIMLLTLAVYSSYGGGCTFPEGWSGTWFQSGYPGLITINSTHIHSKGECTETDSNDKFLVYERNDDCYRCMVIHEKHKYVLQFKETYCSQKDSLSSLCESITGDAALFSMFRKEPRPVPQPCPFHPAPFTFSYNRGTGDCSTPASRAEACTDDSRLLLRYMACTDVPSTESNVEELVCLATWKEGSTRYLVGQLQQVQRRNNIASDEDTYRCFIYKGQHSDKSMTYNIAQSGDATCNGLASPTDGSRTMKLTTSDDEHNRCHFPGWIVDHHKWFSLDHTHQYHFTTKNATLKIMKVDGSFEEKRLVCHSILEHRDKQHIKLVAHVTRGCESGHVCLKLYHRSSGVLELQQGSGLWDASQDACTEINNKHALPFITLITTSLAPARCPMSLVGRYAVSAGGSRDRPDRTRRQNKHALGASEGEGMEGVGEGLGMEGGEAAGSCAAGGDEYVSASVGCGHHQDTIDLKSPCHTTQFTCYGSWREESSGLGFVVAAPAARGSPHPRTFCFIYKLHSNNDTSLGTSVGVGSVGSGGSMAPAVSVSLWSASGSCARSVRPRLPATSTPSTPSTPAGDGDKPYNLTINGTCEQSSKYNSMSVRPTAGGLFIAFVATLALYGR